MLSGVLLLSFLWLGNVWFAKEETSHLDLIPDDAEIAVVVNSRSMAEIMLYEYLDNRVAFDFFKEFQKDKGSSFLKESGASGINVMSPIGLFVKTTGGKKILGMVLSLSGPELFLPYAEATWSLNNRTGEWWHSNATAASISGNSAIILHCLQCEFSQNILADWSKPTQLKFANRNQKVSASVEVKIPENRLLKTIFPSHEWKGSITADYGRILLDAETDYWEQGIVQNPVLGAFPMSTPGIVMNAYVTEIREQGPVALEMLSGYEYFRHSGLFQQLTGHISVHVKSINSVTDRELVEVNGVMENHQVSRYDAEMDLWLHVSDAHKVSQILNTAKDSGLVKRTDDIWVFDTDYEGFRVFAKMQGDWIQLCTDRIMFNRSEFKTDLQPNPVFELRIGITDLLKRITGLYTFVANKALDINILDAIELKWVGGQKFSGAMIFTDKNSHSMLSIMKFIVSSPQVTTLVKSYF